MKILKSDRKDNTIFLEIEESTDRYDDAFKVAYNRIKKDVSVGGFRKGKVPQNVFERHYGKKFLVEEAVQEIVSFAYGKAIHDLKLKVIDMPKNLDLPEFKEDEPFKFTCEVEVLPEVKLGKYKGVNVKQDAVNITDNDLNEHIDKLLDQFAKYELVKRAAADKDIIKINIKSTVDGEVFDAWTLENYSMLIGTDTFGKEFDQKIIGASAEDKKTFSCEFKDDFWNKQLQDKTVDFEVEVIEVQEKIKPELSDEIVKKISKQETVDAFKTDLKETLTKQETQKSEDKLRISILDIISENAKIDISDTLKNKQLESSLNQFKSTLAQSRLSIDDYLKMTNKTIDDIKKELEPDAIKQIKHDLVLSEIATKENIDVSDDDIQEELNKINDKKIKTVEDLRKNKNIDINALTDMIKKQKTYSFLLAESKIKN